MTKTATEDTELAEITARAAARRAVNEAERAEQAAVFAQADEYIGWARRNGYLR